MKIEANTILVLKNFSKINPSIFIAEGNILKTISSNRTIMAKSTVTTVFPSKFAIYNLDRFISTLSLFDDPEVTFQDKFVTVSNGSKKINYVYADESTILKAPEKELVLPSVDISVTITAENFKDVEKAMGVLNMPEIVISGDSTNIYLETLDSKNPSGDVYSIIIGNTDKTFKAIFKCENIKIIPGDYLVEICSKGISHFKGEKAEYFVAVESTSTF